MSSPTPQAVLQAGDTETLYRRAGEGPPVLLLCSGVLAEPRGGHLFERLARHARVIAAAVPRGMSAVEVLETWLGEVTEGLGLVRPTLVIDAALGAGLLEGAETITFDGVIVAATDGGDATVIAELVRGFLDSR